MRTYLEEIATADIAVDIEAPTLNKLFEEAGVSFSECTAELDKVEEKIEKEIVLEAENTEKLLFKFLEELVFIKDTELLIFKKFNCKIENNKLICKARGEELNQKKHEVLDDIKAITYHQFKVRKEKNWKARIIFDI